jgi:hypothetical protein
MKTFILSILGLCLINVSLYSQPREWDQGSQKRHAQTYTEKVFVTGNNILLEARFTADVTSGVKPLTVHFTDESIGNPSTWAWDFGDNQSSSERHPVHIYAEAGVFSVKLTISDGTNTYSLVKENYITVADGSENCDTLDFPLPGIYTYYLVVGNEFGYVSGNNSYEDKAKANFFDNYPTNSEIKGVLFDFAVARNLSGINPEITFAIWDNSGAQGTPGAIKASAEMSLSEIVQDVDNQLLTYVEFSAPLLITGPFYAGVILPVNTGDTIALWTNTQGDVSAGKAWEQWSDNSWIPYSTSWELNIANGIHPVVCESSQDLKEFQILQDVSLYPNPASSSVSIRFTEILDQNVTLSIYNIMGVLMEARTIPAGHSPVITFKLEGYSKGLYFMTIEINKQKTSKKIHII